MSSQLPKIAATSKCDPATRSVLQLHGTLCFLLKTTSNLILAEPSHTGCGTVSGSVGWHQFYAGQGVGKRSSLGHDELNSSQLAPFVMMVAHTSQLVYTLHRYTPK
jgi:hypothetical protein